MWRSSHLALEKATTMAWVSQLFLLLAPVELPHKSSTGSPCRRYTVELEAPQHAERQHAPGLVRPEPQRWPHMAHPSGDPILVGWDQHESLLPERVHIGISWIPLQCLKLLDHTSLTPSGHLSPDLSNFTWRHLLQLVLTPAEHFF